MSALSQVRRWSGADHAGVETGAGDANDQRVVLEMGRGVMLIDLVEVAEGTGWRSPRRRATRRARGRHAIRVARFVEPWRATVSVRGRTRATRGGVAKEHGFDGLACADVTARRFEHVPARQRARRATSVSGLGAELPDWTRATRRKMEGRDVAPFAPRHASVPIRRRVARSGTRASLASEPCRVDPQKASTQIIARDDAPLDSRRPHPEPEPPPPVLSAMRPVGRNDVMTPQRGASVSPPSCAASRPAPASAATSTTCVFLASPRATHPRREFRRARTRREEAPPLSSQPSRPRPTPRASRPAHARASSPTLVPVSTRPTLPDPNAASPWLGFGRKPNPGFGRERFPVVVNVSERAPPLSRRRVGTSPVLVGDSDHLFSAWRFCTSAKMKRAPFTSAATPTRASLVRDGVPRHARRVQIFFWNLTSGPWWPTTPALREIGPFVMHKGKEKKSNVTFHGRATTA